METTTLETTTMHALVKQAQGGDREAFGEIYQELVPKVYRYLYHRTDGRTQLAEDLAEDVFVKVLEQLDKYQDRGLPFASWVFRIAHNRLIDHFRRQPKQGIDSIADCYNLSDGRAEKVLDDRLTYGLLTESLKKLTEVQRRVMISRYLHGMTVPETAVAVGKSADAVKKLQQRGLSALRRSLGGRAVVAELAS